MSKNYTVEDIEKLTELTTHNADSNTALLGYFESDSVYSYEQIAHTNNLTYFDAVNRGWGAMTNLDSNLAYRVNDEFLIKQIEQGKDFILPSDPYKAIDIYNETRKGYSFVKELEILSNNGYKIEKYGEFWRAYK